MADWIVLATLIGLIFCFCHCLYHGGILESIVFFVCILVLAFMPDARVSVSVDWAPSTQEGVSK